jgi:hypothetical protein
MVALSLTRHPVGFPGKLSDFFDGGTQVGGEAANTYVQQVRAAIERFNDGRECEYTTYSSRRQSRCLTKRQAHGEHVHGSLRGPIGKGPFESHFVKELESTWRKAFSASIKDVETSLAAAAQTKIPTTPQSRSVSHTLRGKEESAFTVHHDRLRKLFQTLPGLEEKARNQLFVCYCCLHETPFTVLECGHTICESCAKALARLQNCRSGNDKRTILLTSCPLHGVAKMFRQPRSIYLKPMYSGVKILTLDGGGVRGVIELEMLKAVETALGGQIPIHRFFDLIGGTSTGGLITLGLGTKDWSLARCEKLFPILCEATFVTHKSARFASKWSPFKTLGLLVGNAYVDVNHGYRYKHARFERQLKELLGDGRLLDFQVSRSHLRMLIQADLA